MNYVSVFSGIEAASVAWGRLGWEPLAFSEIDRFPSSVLAYRFPGTPNLGDITKVDWSPYRGADVVVGGSPCQAFSVAGKRGGMDDERGRLMLEFVRAVHDIRPRWFVWENVPGVLSQDRGRAFGALLGEMDELGYGLCWSVLDAQFYGVAQRRRRVFLVGGPTVGCSCAVLIEPGRVPGGLGASREKRASLARAAGERAQGEGECLNPWDVQSHRIYPPDAPSPSLCSAEKRDCLSPVVAYGNTPTVAFRTSQTGANESGVQVGVAHTIDSSTPEAVAFTQYGEAAGTLTARYDSSPCADRGQNIVCMTDTQTHAPIDGEVCGALSATMHKDPPVVSDGWVVRRLTPLECERLQGFPDGWTDIPGAKDGPRYKAIGNSMAVPVMEWIGRRIQLVDDIYRERIQVARNRR